MRPVKALLEAGVQPYHLDTVVSRATKGGCNVDVFFHFLSNRQPAGLRNIASQERPATTHTLTLKQLDSNKKLVASGLGNFQLRYTFTVPTQEGAFKLVEMLEKKVPQFSFAQVSSMRTWYQRAGHDHELLKKYGLTSPWRCESPKCPVTLLHKKLARITGVGIGGVGRAGKV